MHIMVNLASHLISTQLVMAFWLKYQIRGMHSITKKVLDAFYYVSCMYCYNFTVYLDILCLETWSSWKLAINDVIEFSCIFI